MKRLIYLSAVFTVAVGFSGCAVPPEPYDPAQGGPRPAAIKHLHPRNKTSLQKYSEFTEENQPALEAAGDTLGE